MFWNRKKNDDEKNYKSAAEVGQLDKEYLTMKEVVDFLPFSRSYCYELKDKGIIEAVQVGLPNQPSYLYTTRSVHKILLELEKHDEELWKNRAETRKENQRRLKRVRRRLYGT